MEGVKPVKFNNPDLASEVAKAMLYQVLRLRLASLQRIENMMQNVKPKTPYGKGKWLSDVNQVERLIHQTQEFIESREAQDV